MRRTIQYLREGVWDSDLREAGRFRRVAIGSLRALLHVLSNFEKHALSSSAGALTMTTLLAIVPFAATVFSIAKGFGLGDRLDASLVNFARDLPPHLHDVVDRIRELVASINFGQLGAFSSLVVVYTGMSLFVRTERAINRSWQTRARRSWVRRFSDFIALAFFVPVFGVGAMALSSILQSADAVESWRSTAPWLGWMYEAGLGFLPYLMLGTALTALYKFMPSARVRWRPAMIGGVVAAALLLWMNGLYIHFQFGVSQNNQIYAALAALPLLIVYLHIAWTIVLSGAELSHAVQHADLLGAGDVVREASPILRERIALALTDRAVRAFDEGRGGLALDEAATELDVPRSTLDSICEELVEGGVLARTKNRMMPSRPGASISVDDVRAAIRGTLPESLQHRLELGGPLEEAVVEAEAAHRSALQGVRFAVRRA